MERRAAAWGHRGHGESGKPAAEKGCMAGRNGFAKEWGGQEMRGLECPANYFELCFLNSGETLAVCDQENGVSKSN